MHRPLILAAALALPLSASGQSTAPPAQPTFSEHIAPIVFSSCSRCHRPGEAAPFSLLDYADVRKRGRNLLRAIEQRIMPPWHPAPGHGTFRDELRLTDEQIATFRSWVESGMAEGPLDRLPPRPAFTPGWQLGEPDLVVTTSGAYPVPAGGRDIYRNFVLPIDLPEDRWLTAIEVRPSAPSVLHHVVVFLDQKRATRELDGRDGKPGFRGMRLSRSPMIATWAVGGLPQHLPDGLAIALPSGSDLVLQSHLHPSGKPESEQTTIGLHFADRPPTRSLVSIQLPPFFGFTAGLDIPAGEADYHLRDAFELPCAVDAVAVGGHAHLLLRALRMHAELPDGGHEPLLHIPAWDFDWQNRYTFAELVRLPAGAVVHADLRYDNSDQNPDNPNRPPERVRWGRETTDEMGSITLLVTPADERDLWLLQRAVKSKNRRRPGARTDSSLLQRFRSLDKNGDDRLSPDEVPRSLRRFFDRLDRDGDQLLTSDEAAAIGKLLRGGR